MPRKNLSSRVDRPGRILRETARVSTPSLRVKDLVDAVGGQNSLDVVFQLLGRGSGDERHVVRDKSPNFCVRSLLGIIRHFEVIGRHMADMVRNQIGRAWHFDPVP